MTKKTQKIFGLFPEAATGNVSSKMPNRNRIAKSLFTLSAISLSFTVQAHAAEEDEQANGEEEKIIVTGTRIKKVDINNLKPILSINREDFDKQGFANAKEVIDSLTQNSGGTIDNSFTFGFAPAASSVNIRGLGFGHTLVLVDGRRLPIYPVGISGTTNFVDLSSIPTAFIERVDVLTDGASAVYGSDAVSGVINVITRKDIEGISMNYRYSGTSGGGYTTHRYNLITGAQNGDTQIDLIFDIWSQEALWATDRDYVNSDVANSRGSYSIGGASFIGLSSGNIVQHPACGSANDPIGGLSIANVDASLFTPNEQWCGFDRAPFRQLIAPEDKFSLMARLTYEFSPYLELFSRVGFSYSNAETQFEPNLYGGALFNGFGSTVPNNGGIVPAGAQTNPTTGSAQEEPGVFVRRLVEFGPRETTYENHSVNLLMGLAGSFGHGAYDWELGVSYNRTDLDSRSNNILLSGLNAAVDNGLDLFQPIPQSVVDSLSFNATQNAFSSNRVFDFLVSGDLSLNLGAGPVQFAFAMEHVNEKYKDVPDSLILQGDGFDGQSSGGGERDHFGIGGEISIPVSENFEIDMALRWDDYDDASSVNSAISPRVAMAWRPTEKILTRLSWGKSFRAPDMQRLFGGDTQGFIDLLDPENPVDSNGQPCTDLSAADCNPSFVESVRLVTGANIDLKEEEGENLNLGMVFEFDNGIDLSVDYFQIDLEEVVTSISAQSIVNACTFGSLFCEYVNRGPNGSLAVDEAFVRSNAVNFAENKTSGIDLTFDYRWKNDLGSWSSRLALTKLNEASIRFGQDFSRVDQVSVGEFPKIRANYLLDWSGENWGGTLRLNYNDSMRSVFCLGDCNQNEKRGSWLTTHVSTRYALNESTRIYIGINNIANERPPEDPTQTNWPFFTEGANYYNAIGREFYFQIDTRL